MTSRVGSGGHSAFVCQSIGLGLVFGAQVLIARMLGANSYGVFAYVNAWLVVLGIVSRIGLDAVVMRDGGILVARQDWSGMRALLAVVGRWVFSSGTLLALLVMAGALLIVPPSEPELRATFLIGASILPLQALSSLRSSALLALGKVWSGLGPDYLARPVLIALTLILLAYSFGRYDAFIAMAATLISTLLVLLIGQSILAAALPRSETLPLTHISRSHLLGSATTMLLFIGVSQLLYQIDTIVVGAMISPHSAGKYYVAKQLASVASLALIALQTTAAPRLAALQADNKTADLQRLLTSVAWRGFAFSLAYVIGVVLLGKFVLAIFGSEFVAAYPVLVALSIGQLFTAAGGAVGQIAAMTGLQTIGGVICFFAALGYVLLASIAIPHFGILGAAIASAGVTATWIAVLGAVVWRRLHVITAIKLFERG